MKESVYQINIKKSSAPHGAGILSVFSHINFPLRTLLVSMLMILGSMGVKAADYVFMYQNYIFGQSTRVSTDFIPNNCVYTGTSSSTFRNGNNYYIVYANESVAFNTESGSNLTINNNYLYYNNYYLRYSRSANNNQGGWQFRNNYDVQAIAYEVTKSSYISNFSISSGDATISTLGTNSSYMHTDAQYYDIYSFNSRTYYSTDPSVAASNTAPTSGLPSLTSGYTWSISPNSYATVNPTTGAITVSSMPSSDTNVTLSCSITRNGVTKTATKTITLESPKTDPTSLTITSGNTMTVNVGNTGNITYSLVPSPCYENVTFASDPASVATVSNDGIVTGESAGIATITVTAKKIDGTTDANLTKTVTVTVKDKVATPVITFTADANDNTKATATISCTTPGTTIYYKVNSDDYAVFSSDFEVNEDDIVSAYAEKTSDPDNLWDDSEVATNTYVSCKTNAPTISFVQSGSTATVTITAEAGATIYYTTDGNDPTTGSASGPSPLTINNVGSCTVKAIAKNATCSQSAPVSKDIILSGVSGNVVTLFDYEDHNWSYYQPSSKLPEGYPDQLHSPYPRNVKITYYGNGNTTVSTSNDANPGDTFTASTNSSVKVGVDADEDTFVYYKTLERDANNRFPYELIPNPFSVRPTYGTGDTRWRGFYKWRIKSIKNGAVYASSSTTDNTALGVGSTLDAETTYYFQPTDNAQTNANNATSMEIELEALWARAYVVTTGGVNSNTAIGNNNVGYERNFVVLAQNQAYRFGGNNNPRISETGRSATISCYYPDGSVGNTSATIRGSNAITLGSNTKFENVAFSSMTDQTMTADGHDLILGRGVTGTINYVESTSGSPASLDCMLRLESGTINRLTFLRYGGENISGRVTIRSICGSDYDRAKGDNNKLTVSRSSSLFFDYQGSIGAQNKDKETFNLVVKSGKFQESYWVDGDDASYTHTFYCGGNSSGAENYPGVRYVTVEGGEMGSMNGGRGVGSDSETYASANVVTFDLRIKGGLFHGSVFGSAADNPSIGSRKIVITGGEIQGWVAAGANGIGQENRTSTVNGDSYVYVGGNVIVGGPRARTVNSTRGGNVFGASRGKDQEAAINTSRVVIADNAEISNSSYPVDGGNVYGGGFSGFAKVQSNVYILGGTISNSVYGGGYGCRNANVTPEANIWMNGGTVLGGVFGGNNTVGKTSNVNMYINGGTVGSPSVSANVHGGGYGQATAITGNVNIIVGTQGASSGATIYGDVYGGSALGQVNATATVTPTYNNNGYVTNATITNVAAANNTSTNVTLNAGTINGSLYGGGLGDLASLGAGHSNVAANVYGPVAVKVYGGSVVKTDNNPGGVFGANNLNGAPQSSVTVDIYSTDAAPGEDSYAINAVYGGGNMPDYINNNYPTVTVHNGGTNNSIGYVYGGGNAARVRQTQVKVYGGNKIGNVFGGGNGTDGAAPVTNNSNVDIYGGTILNVFGGSNTNGLIGGNITVNVIEGAESGTSYALSPVNITNVYGGGNNAPYVASNTGYPVVNISNGKVTGNVFGGGKGVTAGVTGSPVVTIGDSNADHKAIVGNVYGGGDAAAVTGNTSVTYNDNNASSSVNNLFGGGNMADVSGSVTVNMTKGKVTGDLYGGGALANTNTSSGATIVNLTGGTVNNVYGGGLGQKDGFYGATSDVAAIVNGNVTVTLDGSVVTGKIFGCNNLNGTPKGHVKVWVKQTVGYEGHDVTDGKKDDTVEKTGLVYELAAVYGGGNMAAYEPTSNDEKTEVIIDGCDLTSIEYVYGGGNAASVPATDVTVNGAYEISYVFGGGNGKDDLPNGESNPGANVGYRAYTIPVGSTDEQVAAIKADAEYGSGKTAVKLFGGTIHNAFGGSNTKGNVKVLAEVTLDHPEDDSNLCALVVDNVFGAGNEAPMDGTANIILGCVDYLSEIYGGANQADLNNNVVLTIQSGSFGRVFGGNNLSGDILGTITVNIEETGCKPIIIGELYGGGNQAKYTAPSGEDGPTVNVKSFTSIGRVFGGGLGAAAVVTGDTYVNIDEAIITTDKGHSTKAYAGEVINFSDGKSVTLPPRSANTEGAMGIIGEVYGGGNEAKVVGNTNVNIATLETVDFESLTTDKTKEVKGANIVGNIYGGGNQAEVTGKPTVTIGKQQP